MFKKLKDKLAEEVKSSPQRIQQFAQAAQAAVTSASSSISDITNSDLFSIGDNDNPQNNQARPQTSPNKPQNMFQDVNLLQSPSDSLDYTQEMDSQRQRRLSNSSFASDVSFRLPSYETPSMYHLQSDMEVSASEADERGFSGGPATLDRVTKEQLYAAYKRTQERYTKYRTQYGDLARHYKLLERENAKARSVLVETQDKALRRISELKEQCALEQSAKAHLEKAMRVEIEEKNMKIETLNTKIQLLQSDNIPHENEDKTNSNEKQASDKENEVQLINLSNDSQVEDPATELTTLNNKIEKMEMLLNKYKESLKTTKEKNSQISAELQKVTHELECKSKEIEDLKVVEEHLNEAKNQIKQLNDEKEDLQNQINTFDFNKTRELSTLEIDLQKANEEIADLQKKIDVFHKREEEYAISLAENKLSIHKELESKETEIKSLKDMLDASKKEIMSLNIVISDYKNNVSSLEEEKTKLNNNCAELNSIRTKFNEAESQLQDLSKKCQSLEQIKTKADEEYKCLQLQLKQETAEKLAMIDRNTYLESRNTQLTDDISKKNSQISQIESELRKHLNSKNQQNDEEKSVKDQLVHEATMWKEKCCKLESEIQEERVELVKLQEEIEKLLANHQLLQAQNAEFRVTMANLTSENVTLNEEVNKIKTITANMVKVTKELRSLKSLLTETSNTTRSFISTNNECFNSFTKDITAYVTNYIQHSERKIANLSAKYNKLTKDYKNLENELDTNYSKNLEILRESDKIREENIKLTEENQSMDKKLNDISTLHETNVAELNDLKHEKVTLMENLKAVESTRQETELALTNEKNQHSKTLELVKTMELEKKLALTNEKDQHSETSQLVKTMELEKQELQNKLQVIDNENEILKNQYDALNEKYEKVNSEINDLKSEISMKSNEVEKYKSINDENALLKNQYDVLNEKYEKLNNEINDLKSEISMKSNEVKKYKLINDENALIKNQYDALNEKYEKVNSEINDLKSEITIKSNEVEKYKSINDENALLKNEYDVLNEKYEKVNSEINDLKSEISIKSNEVEKYKSIQESLEKEIAQYALNGERLSSLEQDKQAFELKINELNDKNNKLVAELKDLSDLQKVSEETITRLSKDIENKSNEIGDKLLQISELEDSIQSLTQENIRLKTDTSNFVSNINQLESEIDDIKKSHAEIEGEKDRLNNIIEKLEKQSQKEYNSIDIQTDENSREDVQIPENAPTMFENKWVLENKQSLMSNTASLNMMTNAQEDAFEKYNSLQTKYDSLKDENKRLQSDIEGLQSYLTKISKENSILNDKLREVIASSEHSVDDNTSADIIEIRNEVKLNKEKINDLLRENSLLIEENLELKDQLQSQNYSKTKEVLNSRNNNTEIEVGSEKYDNLMEVNNQLQKRNMDLEQINKSVNGNMSQLQEKNERLKLSNEKLERRLDEALVSLRHLHSLQENTELEYLRNILYEYLTGSGTHSVTLAKVLSAIVKFDDSQTQQVLQKEKERQGFLRQLGLI